MNFLKPWPCILPDQREIILLAVASGLEDLVDIAGYMAKLKERLIHKLESQNKT